jgi:5-methylcytosine-specific restriction endonuclease McrA
MSKTANPFYNSTIWKQLRLKILARDGYTCVRCKLTLASKDLQVDHIVPMSTHPQFALEPGNLQTLCRRCHTRAPTSMGRNSDYRERPFVGLDGLPEGW